MKIRFPHTYLILFSLIILVAILTWFIPGGDYVEKPVLSTGKK
ncbi:MAG: hypothetical protein HGA23_11565 [Bacteroidales bacterium]|nr:hypothetical protein [Bacteroidales bacterium]